MANKKFFLIIKLVFLNKNWELGLTRCIVVTLCDESLFTPVPASGCRSNAFVARI